MFAAAVTDIEHRFTQMGYNFIHQPNNIQVYSWQEKEAKMLLILSRKHMIVFKV